MLRILFFISLLVNLNASEFRGWEGLRVLPLEGGLAASDSGDFDGSGRDSLFIANRRQSRIDIYSWLPKNERKKAYNPESPNELPMAPDFDRKEIILERPPFDIQLKNIDDDKELELLVLTTLPLTLNRYDYANKTWSLTESWKLPNINTPQLSFLYYRNSVFISSEKGILIQKLEKNAVSEWLKPVESNVRRLNWWIYDVNGDGEEDLVDLIIDDSNRVRFRWFTRNNNVFLPAVPLGNVKGTSAAIDTSLKKPTFYIQNPIRRNTVNEYTLEAGDVSIFGRNRLLPRLNIRDELKTSVVIDGRKILVEIDPEKPMMRAAELSENGFKEIGSFPILRKTVSIVAPAGKPFLLMQVGESPDIYISRWEKERFSYPSIFISEENHPGRKLIGFGMHAGTVWWVHSQDDDLLLSLWPKGQEKQETVNFKGIGKGLDQAFWLGGNSLMVRKKYAKYASFYRLENDKPQLLQAAHLKDSSEGQFRFFMEQGKMKLARIVDGILQWYGDELQPVDQVMLENGEKITAAVYADSGSMYVLDQSGEKIHEFTADKSGLMKESNSFEVIEATSLENDPNLGIILANNKFFNAVSKGSLLKLKLKNSVNEQLGLPDGVRNATINNFHLLDVTGTKRDELFTVDFQRHQMTLIDMSKDKPVSLASWKVFDDGKYPYSDGGGNSGGGQNPYLVISMDFDGDGVKELVMGCHDRLLIYLGREEK